MFSNLSCFNSVKLVLIILYTGPISFYTKGNTINKITTMIKLKGCACKGVLASLIQDTLFPLQDACSYVLLIELNEVTTMIELKHKTLMSQPT